MMLNSFRGETLGQLRPCDKPSGKRGAAKWILLGLLNSDPVRLLIFEVEVEVEDSG